MNPLSNEAVSRLQKMISEPDLTGTKYRLLRKIGSGGMAEVYLVFDEELEREAALKVIHPARAGDDDSARMMREAKAIARLEHPSIVPVHDLGTLPDGRIFYVMKYIQGELLDSYAARTSMHERLTVLQKIGDAVSFAHSHGVIHRDLKPQNIMVGAFGDVQVMDWGLAKVLSQLEPKAAAGIAAAREAFQTDAGTVMGTPEYMAPEQERGDGSLLNEKTDIYALGAILYNLLTLRPPQRDVRPRQLNGAIPRRLEAICLKAMAPVPNERYGSVVDLTDDISAYLNGLPMVAYRENIFEKLGRWTSRNSFFVLLVLAYLLMRAILLFLSRR